MGRSGHEVVVTPGNPGIPGSTPAPPDEIDADLCVIGPEAPPVDGLVSNETGGPTWFAVISRNGVVTTEDSPSAREPELSVLVELLHAASKKMLHMTSGTIRNSLTMASR